MSWVLARICCTRRGYPSGIAGQKRRYGNVSYLAEFRACRVAGSCYGRGCGVSGADGAGAGAAAADAGRAFAAAGAGRGGAGPRARAATGAVASLTGASWQTVGGRGRRGRRRASPPPPGRVRRPGGGRRPLAESDPGLLPALEALVRDSMRGDPAVAFDVDDAEREAAGRRAGGGRAPVLPGHRVADAAPCRATRCSRTRRRPRAGSTRSGTPSSATSPRRQQSTWPPGSRSSAWTPRSGRRSGTTGRTAASGGRRAARRSCGPTTSRKRAGGTRSPTAFTTRPRTPGS